MPIPYGSVIDSLRQPAYTGANRCYPCTVVNVLVAVILAAAVTVLIRPRDPGTSVVLGGMVLLVSLGSIYFRGYLVPGTPWFTKTYFPDWVLRRFDTHPPPGPEPASDDIDVEAVMRRAGIVTECDQVDDLCLTDDFSTGWYERIANLREDETTREHLASILGVDPDRLTLEEHGNAFVARVDGRRTGQWESEAAVLADVAAAAVLRDEYNAWAQLDERSRSSVLNGLRIFLDRCPSCDGPVSINEDVVESCCRSIDVFAVRCHDCGARLFEAEQPG